MCREEAGEWLHEDLLLSFCISPEQGTKLGAKSGHRQGKGRKETEAREAAEKVGSFEKYILALKDWGFVRGVGKVGRFHPWFLSSTSQQAFSSSMSTKTEIRSCEKTAAFPACSRFPAVC